VMNYDVEKVLLVRGGDLLSRCSLLVVAGPKAALLPPEVAAVRAYLAAGGNAFFMLDPFVRTGLEPIVREYGVVLDDTIVIDEASHFWADVSSPAVTSYNHHLVTVDLPLTFFPGVRSLSPTPGRVPGTTVVPILNTVNYLAAEENLIGIAPRTYDLPRVNLTNRQMKGTFFLSVILVPALLAVVGTAVWWRQR